MPKKNNLNTLLPATLEQPPSSVFGLCSIGCKKQIICFVEKEGILPYSICNENAFDFT